ncbi:hypothetical protein LTR95_008141 [Oleoguttula sp. CCFEE 5521]
MANPISRGSDEEKAEVKSIATADDEDSLATVWPAPIEGDDIESGHAKDDKSAVERHPETVATEPERMLSLTRTSTRRSARSSKDPGPPPDGGRVAWTQHYNETLDVSPSAISWIGSVQIFLLFFLGTWSGRALDAGLFRYVYCTGSVFQLLGIFSLSAATEYWEIFLAQGVCLGIANGLHFCPSMSLVSTYFSKKRSFATGLTALGSCTGGVVFPVIVQQLLPRVGFPWTIRACGFLMVITNAVTISLYRTRLPPRKTGPIVEWSALKEPTFTLYGRNVLGMTYPDSINLLLTMVAIGFLWRILPNFYADRLGPVNVIIPFAAVCAIMMFGWIGIHTRATLFVYAAIYGSGSAGLQSMFPAALASLTTDMSKAGVRMGMGFTIVSFACLTGPPLAGALIQLAGGRYLYAQIWGGASFMMGVALLVAARTAKVGWHVKRRI